MIAVLIALSVWLLFSRERDSTGELIVGIGLGAFALWLVPVLLFNIQIGRALAVLSSSEGGRFVAGFRGRGFLWIRSGYAVALEDGGIEVASVPLVRKPHVLERTPTSAMEVSVTDGRFGTSMLRLETGDGVWTLRGNRSMVSDFVDATRSL